MKIYKVGPEELDKFDLENLKLEENQFKWMVYWYEIDMMEGSGEAVALHVETGLLHVEDLGHCSCYGPLDDGILLSGDTYTVEKFLSDKDDITEFDARKEVKDKVRELLGLEVKS